MYGKWSTAQSREFIVSILKWSKVVQKSESKSSQEDYNIFLKNKMFSWWKYCKFQAIITITQIVLCDSALLLGDTQWNLLPVVHVALITGQNPLEIGNLEN